MDKTEAATALNKVFERECFAALPAGCELTPEKDLRNDLGLDSIDVIELAMGLEERFFVEITDETVEGWKTYGDVLKWVEEQAEV